MPILNFKSCLDYSTVNTEGHFATVSAHKTNCRKSYAFLIRTKIFINAENDKIVPSYFEYYLNDTKNSYYEFHRYGFRF